MNRLSSGALSPRGSTMRCHTVIPFQILGAALLARGLGAQSTCTEPGKELWGLKSNVPLHASITKAKLIPLADLMDLAAPSPAPKSNLLKRKRLPAFANPHHVKEGDIVRTRGFLRLVATSDNDCEYHIQLTTTASATSSFIVEIARESAASIKSTFVRGKAAAVRKFIRDDINGGREPSEAGRTIVPPVFVEVAGQLFFDSGHSPNDQRGKAGMPAATLWEIHPILSIKRARAPNP